MFQNSLEKVFWRTNDNRISLEEENVEKCFSMYACMRMTYYTNANIFPWVDHIVPTLVMLLKKTCQHKVEKNSDAVNAICLFLE